MTTEALESPARAENIGIQATQAVQATKHVPSVKLSASALTLLKLEQTLSTLPIIDRLKVESIKMAIAKGQYVVDPQKTADKFVRLESALHSK